MCAHLLPVFGSIFSLKHGANRLLSNILEGGEAFEKLMFSSEMRRRCGFLDLLSMSLQLSNGS